VKIFVPALMALFIAVFAAYFHTVHTARYFQPTMDDLLSALMPWGEFLTAAWGPHLGRLAAALLFFASLPGLGARLLKLFRPTGETDLFVQSGAALAGWGTLGFLLAAGGVASVSTLRVVSILLILLGLTGLRQADLSFPPFGRAGLKTGAGAGLLFFAGLYLLTTVVPETFYDALVYHLAVPQAYLQSGRMVDLSDIHLTRLPGLIQTLYLWALAWSDDRLCKLLNWGIGLLLTGALGAWVGKKWSPAAGRWAALLFLSSPMIGVNLWSCTNDLLCGFFFFLSFSSWNDAWGEREDADMRRLLVAGLFFGAALATKYTAASGVFFFALDLIVRRKRTQRLLAPPGLAFAAGVILLLLPWFFRASAWTGNPFFPKATALLGGDIPENLALLSHWESEARGEGGLLFRTLALLRESLTGVDAGRFGFLGPVLLMLLPFLPFVRYGRPSAQLLGCALVSYIFFAVTTGRLRYFIPQIGLLFALAAAAMEDYIATAVLLAKERNVAGRIADRLGDVLKFLVSAVLFLNALWLVLIFQKFNQGWDVVWGRQSEAEYLRREHTGVYGHPSQGAFDFLREADLSGRVFLVGDARTYRCPLPARASGAFNVPPFALWAKETPTPASFIERLRREGYTHLLVNVPELRRITPSAYQAPEYAAFLGHVLDSLPSPLYRDPWSILFRVPAAG